MVNIRESDIVKKPQRNSFKLNPIAAAVAIAMTTQFAVNVAYAGAGNGSGVTTANSPVNVPTYYANSPSGPAPVYVNGVLQIRADGSNLPFTAQSGTMLRKFVDTLPGFGAANANNLGQYIPVAVAEKWVDLNGAATTDDYYEIAAVEFRERMHSDLPATGTHLRGYVQLETAGNAATSKHIALTYPNGTAITDAARITAANPTGQVYAYDNPHHLGPVITATKGTAVRVKFTNYLPIGGKLFLPVDPTITGTGMGPDGVTPYPQNRAGMHLVGGQSPWISAGSPHQWVAPAGELAAYAAGIGKGASVQNVPDMADPGAGSTYLYFPNDMSARFTFIQDRTTGLTRLNAYAGLEAGYVVTDPIEQTLINGGTLTGGALKAPVTVAAGTIPAAQIPLIIEDKTFVPANIAQQDALWTDPNWGTTGDLWFPHVYEPNQNPSMANGANPVGRWDYGPLFWPIFPVAATKATLPSPSFVPEAYMDTPLVNGTAYPTLTVEPKAYRVRLLNASNDRYINLGLYKADPTATRAPQLDANGNPVVDKAGNQQFLTNTEVKMIPAAADVAGNPANWDKVNNVQLPLPQFGTTFPWNINAEPSGPSRAWPTDGRAGGAPDPTTSGPDFVVIGNDGGLLPQGVDIPSQPVTYEQNRRSITVLNIYGYGMLLGPAERADAIVDFSAYAGQTLILYNDAPAPTPFNDPRNDYYTGDPDQSGQGGAYSTLPGYGPNTRTIMQIKVGTTVTSGGPLNAVALAAALPAAYGASQPAPLVPEVAYNAAFGTSDVDNFGRVATGSAAQPTLDFAHTGALTLTGLSLVTSGGPGTGSGSGYLTAPAVVITSSNGVGSGASATAVVDPVTHQVTGITGFSPGSGYTAVPTVTFVPGNTVSGITVTDGGSGYTSPVTVNFTGGGGTGAAATVTLSSVSQVSTTLPAGWLVNGGSGYLVPPKVSFTGTGTGATGTATISTSPLTLGAGAVLVSNAGSGYTAPTAVVSAPQNAGTTATASAIVGFAVAPITIAAPIGAGFDQPTTAQPFPGTGTTVVNFSLPQLAGGTLPTATPLIDPLSGAITGITLLTPGSGYTAAPTVTISDGKGNSATAPATLAPASGQVFGATILTAGSGYTAPATITFTDATGNNALATANLAGPAGTVTGLAITNGGGGYSSAPTVVFTDQTPVGPTHAAAVSAQANVALVTPTGAIIGITVTNPGTGFTSAPAISFTSATGTGALATAGIAVSGVGAQASVLTTTTSKVPVVTKAEQELFDDYGRYNSTGGIELPLTLAGIQTTVPLNYIDAPTDIIGDDEVQIWKLVDNGFWSNSIHFNMNDVQLINRVGWDGTVKPPASNEVGWKDTIRLNPLEDAIVAIRGKATNIPFSLPRSSRLQDPSLPANAATGSGMGFTNDPAVVSMAGLQATNPAAVVAGGHVVPANTPLLTVTNLNAFPGSPTGNYDNEFVWGSAILGHSEDDFTRPVVFNPVVNTPDSPLNLADSLGTGTLTWTDPTPVGQLASAPGVLPVVAATLGNTKNELGFKLLQAPVTNGQVPAQAAFTPVAAPFANLPANAVMYKEPAALVAPNLPQYYAYEVVAANVAGDSQPSNIVVEAPPTAPTVGNGIPLLTPTFLPLLKNTADVQLTMQWQDNAVNETNYIVTKTGGPGAVLANGKVTGGSVTTLTAPANPLPISTNTTFVDPAPLVEGAPYEYDIVARNSFGDSTPVLTGTLTAPISIPLAPTNALATPTIATCPAAVPVRCKPDDVVLTWTDNAFNETSYTVARTGGNVPFATVTLPASALNAAPGTMTYKDATAQEGVLYTYTVSAVNAAGATTATATATVIPTAPTLPTNLVVTPSTAVDANGTYVDTVALTWSDNAYNEMTYQVLRDGAPVGNQIVGAGLANNPMGTATAGWTASPTLTFTDVGLIDGTSHTWSVQAANAVGTTTSVGVTKTMPGIVIAPPTNLLTTPNRAGSSIGLQWTDMSTNETDFLVEESVSSTGGAPGSFTNWTVLQVVPRSAAQTTATGGLVNINRANVPATPGFVYTFRVSARNLTNKSDSHPYLYGQSSLQAPVLTAAPTLAVPTLSATGRVGLSWTAVAAPAGTTISYVVNINGQLINTNQLTYNFRPTVAQLQAGMTFTVQAVATAIRVANPTVFGSTTGPASNVQTTKIALPAVPTGLKATAPVAAGGGNYTSTLSWTAVTGATGYVIQPFTNGVAGALINVAGGTTLTRNVNLVAGNTYTYQIAATDLVGTSAYSTPAITVNTPPAQSTGLAANLLATRSIAVTWVNLSTNITGFTVQRRLGAGAWTTITPAPTVTQNGTAYSITNTVTAAGSYTYRLLATSAGGSTAYTAASNAVVTP